MRADQPEALRLAAEALDLWQSGRIEDATARYERAIALADPGDFRTPDIHGQYASLLTAAGRQYEAGNHYEMALKLELRNEPAESSPAVLMARYVLGEHYLAMGEAESARRVIAPSLAAAPRPLAWIVEAEALYLAGALPEARAAAEQAIALAASDEQRERLRTRLAEVLGGPEAD